MARNHAPSQINDGALQILEGLDIDGKSPLWKTEATILNIADQKYTIGSGKDFDKVFNPEDHGQFLLFQDKSDVSKLQCQISCNTKGEFWLQNMEHYSEIFLNGKLLQDSPVRLRFGDVFYFSHTLSQSWDPLAIGKLCVKNKDGTQQLTVFKFERLISKSKCKEKTKTRSKTSDTKTESDTRGFQKVETRCSNNWDSNSVILTKVFEHLANSPDTYNYQDILNCRLVSKCWNQTASLVLKTNFAAKFNIVVDDIIANPNKVAMRLHWFANRMSSLNFENWQMEFWPARYGEPIRDNAIRDKAVVKFKQNFSTFMKQEQFHLKSIDMNIDYLFPINQFMSKFCHTLERVAIQVNMLWIRDEAFEEFPENVNFPKLKTLILQFSSLNGHPDGDLRGVIESKWLKCFLACVSGIEHLVLKNFARIPVEFKGFKNLKSVTIHGETAYGVYELQLHKCLEQLISLPKDQLESFSLICLPGTGIDLDEPVDQSLPRFLERQRNSLERLELTCPGNVKIRLPQCMPNLKKLWISYDGGSDFVFGTKLQSQVTSIGTGFDDEFQISMLPILNLSKSSCRSVSYCDHKLSLAFGRWDLNNRQFVSYIPNVESIWAWTR